MALADQFIANGGKPIMVAGREVHWTYWIPASQGTTLWIDFVHAVTEPTQGLGLLGEHCKLRCHSTVAKSLVFWYDAAPSSFQVEVLGPKPEARIGAFNLWRDPKYGSTMARLNNAGMLCERLPDGGVLLRCSDGWGDPQFADLIAQLRVESP